MPGSRTCEESDVLVKSQKYIFLAIKHITKQLPAENKAGSDNFIWTADSVGLQEVCFG